MIARLRHEVSHLRPNWKKRCVAYVDGGWGIGQRVRQDWTLDRRDNSMSGEAPWLC